MPTRKTNANGTFLSGFLDDYTGESVNYRKVTNYPTGEPLTNTLVDGRMYRKIGNEFFKLISSTGGEKRVNVRSLGLVADGVTDNSLRFAQAIESLPRNTNFFFPDGEYLFNKLPAKYNIFNVPTAINTHNTGACFQGESREFTVIKIGPGCIGIQITGGLAPRPTLISDLTITGPGENSLLEGLVTNSAATKPDGSPNPDAGRAIGSASLDNANYNFNGINMWGQTHLHNVNVDHFSGHNLCIFGAVEVRIQGIPVDLSGTCTDLGGGSVRFALDDPGQITKVQNEERCTLGGFPCKVGGLSAENGLVFLSDVPAEAPKTGRQPLVLLPGGGPLIADNSTITGLCNFDFPGGSGLFITSSDANQLTMFGGSFRECGLWGVDEGSFLGSFFYGTHFSACGKRINRFGVDNIFGNDELPIGPFIQRYPTARSGFYGTYTEEGNQGPARVEANCSVVDGIQGAGVIGGYRREGSRVSGLYTGEFSLLPNTFSLGYKRAQNIPVIGTFVGHTPSGGSEQIMFVPSNLSDISKATVGQKLNAYRESLTITAILPGQGLLLGPLIDFFPPRSPTTTPTIAQLVVAQPAAREPLQYHEDAMGRLGFGYGQAGNGQGEQRMLTFADTGKREGPRIVVARAPAVDGLYINSQYQTGGTSPQAILGIPLTQILPGDTVRNLQATASTPMGWECVQAGTTGTLPVSFTATPNGPTLRFTASLAQHQLRVGDTIQYGSQALTITQLVDEQAVSTAYFAIALVNEGTQPISFAAPKFRPTGSGIGTTAQRPDLTGLVGPWQYFNTNTNTMQTWTGTAWV